MTELLRFTPGRLALGYVALSVIVLGLFAVPLWYMWGVNISTFRAYVDARDTDSLVRMFEREGPAATVAAIEARLNALPPGEVVVLADPSKSRLAGNLSAWPAELPDAGGTYGLVTDIGGSSMRIVGTHIVLPGGYHLLMGRESARFQSLVDYFWFGIAGAVAIALLLGAVVGWLVRRALLFEVQRISSTATAIVDGDRSRRVPERHGSTELNDLASIVNSMLEQLARHNAALTEAHDNLEHLVAQRTAELAAANASLRQSETRFSLAVDAAGDGFSDWIVATDEFYASPRLLEMCGLPADTRFDGRADFLARFPFHPEDRERVIAAIGGHFEAGSIRLEQEMRIVRHGQTRWLHLTGLCSRDASGALVRWNTAITDVTERKHAELALTLSEDELRARQDMLDLAQKAARAVVFEWRIGEGNGENRWSPDLEALYGLAPGSYDGTYESWKKLVYPDDWPRVRAAIKSAQQTGEVDAEYRVGLRGGGLRWLQAKGRMFFDPDDLPTRLVGFMLDVTDRHLAEDELRRMERQLRQAQRLESMGTLAGGIAHDFNNLLGAILGYGEMALRDAPPGSRLHRDLSNIMVAGERGRALVDRILAFSRSGVGERVAVDVEAVVRETLRIFASKLPAGIAVDERLAASRAAVMGDATQIHQVLMNLVTNAVQAMPAGGTLLVALDEADIDAPRVATTGTLGAGRYIVLKVADTGSGIAQEVVERIFDPFFTTKEVGVGTGLGLSLVHGIVTGLGGAIDVSTAIGKGTTFAVYLPRAGDIEGGEAPAAAALPVARGAHRQVLVIDDEPSLVTLTTERLHELGYTPVGFTSSTVALEAFMADPERFEAVITDESMPGMSGAELIAQLRAIRPKVPILLVSGYLSTELIRRARDAGADEVARKPLSARDLADALERVLHPSGVSYT